MSKNNFIGKKCKIFYNDYPDHVAYLVGIVESYDALTKEVIIKNEYNGISTAVTRIRLEVLK